jgi:uncharacterized integral membrane protein
MNYKEIKLYNIFTIKEKNMAEILKFIFTMILFLLLFLVSIEAGGGKQFSHPFKGKTFSYPFKILLLLCNSYTTFYRILITLFYYSFSLQHILIVKPMLTVQKL